MLLPWAFTAASAATVQIGEFCTATLGLPSCFPHDGLIDWSVTTGIDHNSAPTFAGPVSGIPGLSFTFTSAGGGFFANGCVGPVPNNSGCVDPIDTWAAWGFSPAVRPRLLLAALSLDLPPTYS